MRTRTTTEFIVLCLIAGGWLFTWGWVVLTVVFLARPLEDGADINGIDLFAGFFLIVPFLVVLILRFAVIPRFRNAWFQLLVFAIAMGIAYFMVMSGIFLVDQHLKALLVLFGITQLIYFPLLIHPKSASVKLGIIGEERPE